MDQPVLYFPLPKKKRSGKVMELNKQTISHVNIDLGRSKTRNTRIMLSQVLPAGHLRQQLTFIGHCPVINMSFTPRVVWSLIMVCYRPHLQAGHFTFSSCVPHIFFTRKISISTYALDQFCLFNTSQASAGGTVILCVWEGFFGGAGAILEKPHRLRLLF